MIRTDEPDLKTAVRIMQAQLAGDALFYGLTTDQQIYALLTLAASLARVDAVNFVKRSKNARMKWADMIVRAVVPDLGNIEGKI